MFNKGLLLILIVLALIVPARVVAQAPSADDESLLSAFLSYTDLRIRSVQQTLEILAATAEVRSGNWEDMKVLLQLWQQSDAKFAAWYALPDGKYYTADKGLMDVTLADRPYFPALMAGKNVVGDLVTSKSVSDPAAVIAVPIVKDGKLVGAVGASLLLRPLSEDVASGLRLPPDKSFFAWHPSGQIALHSEAKRVLDDPRNEGSESLTKAANEILATESGQVKYVLGGMQKNAVYRTSALTGWKFIISVGVPPAK
jgi:hypothetical protein